MGCTAHSRRVAQARLCGRAVAVAKYMAGTDGRPSGQRWGTFLRNHLILCPLGADFSNRDRLGRRGIGLVMPKKWQREFQSRRISPKSCALRPHGFSGQRPGRQVFFCRGSRAMARVSKGDRETGADGAATIKLTHYRRQGYCPNSGASVRRARGWARTRPWSGRCSERVSLSPSHSCPDCTTITSGYDFRKRQVPRIGQLRCGIKDIGGNSVRGV